MEIPKGTFFLRNHPEMENLLFLATGTGIAPIKSIVESPSNQEKLSKYNKVMVLWGMKFERELFWTPNQDTIEFLPVLSRESHPKQYVQDKLSDLALNWVNTVVYACGSNEMIQEARKKTQELGINSNHFYSDAFVASN
jgi:CDP-4-dehydro-6-deoxyglucose reductase